MPTTRARESASAPPELPGLSAASVWMTSSTTRPARPLRVGSARPSALTTPAVTEPARPSGLPTATTSCPTTSWSASPSRTGGGRSPGRSARSTARSESGSVPTTVTGVWVPSTKSARPGAGLADHVGVGHEHPVGVDDHGRAAAPAGADGRHPAGELGGHRGDGAGVGVELVHDGLLLAALTALQKENGKSPDRVPMSYDLFGVLRGGVPLEPGHTPAVVLQHLPGRALVPADEPVQVDDAVEVVGLVLQAAGEEAAALHLDRRAVGVHTGDLRPLGAPGREVLGGHREAALLVVLGVGHASPAAPRSPAPG